MGWLKIFDHFVDVNGMVKITSRPFCGNAQYGFCIRFTLFGSSVASPHRWVYW